MRQQQTMAQRKGTDHAGEARQLVRLLGIKSGMTIADIGAGSGYYVERLSPIVGARGRIIAEDIVPEYLQNLRKRVRGSWLTKRHDNRWRATRSTIANQICRHCDPGAHVSRDRRTLCPAVQSRPCAQVWRARRHCRYFQTDPRAHGTPPKTPSL